MVEGLGPGYIRSSARVAGHGMDQAVAESGHEKLQLAPPLVHRLVLSLRFACWAAHCQLLRLWLWLKEVNMRHCIMQEERLHMEAHTG